MRNATWKSLWSRKVRLLMSTFAIVLGVAFVAGSLVFTATIDRAFTGILSGSTPDVSVRPAGAMTFSETQDARRLPASLVERIRNAPGVARAEGQVSDYTTFVIDTKGKVVGGDGPPGIAFNYHDARAGHGVPGLRVQEGRPPARSGELALDALTAKRSGHSVGDMVTVVTASKQARVQGRLVGLVGFGNGGGGMAGATMTVFDLRTAQRLYTEGRPVFNDVWVQAEDGVSQDQLRGTVSRLLPSGVEAETGDAIAKESQNEIQKGLGFITTFLLIFAGVALVVGSFLIVNTFSILVAQRRREMALLRALGASRGQLARSVLTEGLVVGFIGSTLGLLLGFLLAMGIKAMFATFGLDLSGTPLQFTPAAVISAYVVGMVVTALAVYLPARRAGQVAPVAAMQADHGETERSVRMRAAAGGVLIALGIALEALVVTGERDQETLLLGTGLFLVVLGVVLAAPLLGRPLIRGVGVLYRRLFGTVGQLAEENSLRQPRRTTATASALMIGLALVTMMSVFGASATRSVDRMIDRNFSGDYVVSGTFGMPFSTTVGDQLEKVDGVRAVARTRSTPAKINGEDSRLGGVDLSTLKQATSLTAVSGDVGRLGPQSVLVNERQAQDLGVGVGDTIKASLNGRTRSFQVAAVLEENAAVPPVATTYAGLTAMGAPTQDNFVYVVREPGADPAAVRPGLDAATKALPTVTVKDQAQFKEEQRRPITQMLMMIYALLGLAVIIAVLGIINTLALSVIERTREIGLLRAVGLSRRQLRRMVRLEAVVISLLGAVLGVGLGLGFGLVLQRTQSDNGISELAVPWSQLALFVALAALVGVLAAWWPARRAARLDVLRAIATE